mmetsp:Transcript_24589/g.75830  ORF Transcript_24589/g.75830 Transcript_24589/m.75830 type:complete len:208 (+) Transcript_24589:969-1592(+)
MSFMPRPRPWHLFSTANSASSMNDSSRGCGLKTAPPTTTRGASGRPRTAATIRTPSYSPPASRPRPLTFGMYAPTSRASSLTRDSGAPATSAGAHTAAAKCSNVTSSRSSGSTSGAVYGSWSNFFLPLPPFCDTFCDVSPSGEAGASGLGVVRGRLSSVSISALLEGGVHFRRPQAASGPRARLPRPSRGCSRAYSPRLRLHRLKLL